MQRPKLSGFVLGFLCLKSVHFAQAEEVVKRVRFSSGRSSTVVTGTTGFENWEPIHKYRINAQVGQFLNVRLLSGKGKVQFDVYKSDNREIFASAGGEDTTSFRARLPASGDYIVSIYGIKKNPQYKAKIQVTGRPTLYASKPRVTRTSKPSTNGLNFGPFVVTDVFVARDRILGVISNTTGKSFSTVWIDIALYTSEGIQLGTIKSFVEDVEPYGKAQFAVLNTTTFDASKYKIIRVRWR